MREQQKLLPFPHDFCHALDAHDCIPSRLASGRLGGSRSTAPLTSLETPPLRSTLIVIPSRLASGRLGGSRSTAPLTSLETPPLRSTLILVSSPMRSRP